MNDQIIYFFSMVGLLFTAFKVVEQIFRIKRINSDEYETLLKQSLDNFVYHYLDICEIKGIMSVEEVISAKKNGELSISNNFAFHKVVFMGMGIKNNDHREHLYNELINYFCASNHIVIHSTKKGETSVKIY